MRSSLNGKIKGLGSYGKYGRASSYPGQRNKRRQKVSSQVHAGQLEKVREEVPNTRIMGKYRYFLRVMKIVASQIAIFVTWLVLVRLSESLFSVLEHWCDPSCAIFTCN